MGVVFIVQQNDNTLPSWERFRSCAAQGYIRPHSRKDIVILSMQRNFTSSVRKAQYWMNIPAQLGTTYTD